ncbi:MAG: Rieske (2Fe-2S) protein [Ignavibacteriales bacterium]|nr:Rieske (2Fe-2S) protein [Ignavibacteriales bacterium]
MTWTRRVFLRETIAGWLALVLAPVGYALARRWTPRNSESGLEAVTLGSVEDFRVSSSRLVSFGSERVIVARSADGTFHAVSGVCTHMGCSIRFEQSADKPEFACNCHDSRFDLDGINLSGPAPSPLMRFDVEASGKELRLLKSACPAGT